MSFIDKFFSEIIFITSLNTKPWISSGMYDFYFLSQWTMIYMARSEHENNLEEDFT